MAMCSVPGPQATACEAAPRSFSRSSVLLREGERSNAFLFVKSGLLAVRQTGLDGVDRAIAVIGPGFLIGQPAARGALPLLFAATARAFGSARPLADLGVGAILALVIFLFFVKLLGLSLPSGLAERWF